MNAAGYKQSHHDHYLFTRQDASIVTLLVVYVDDIIITGDNEDSIATLKAFLHSKLELRDLGSLKYFLGIEIARCTAGIFLNQRKYTLELIHDSGILGAKPFDTPTEQHLNLTSHEFDNLFDNPSTISTDVILDEFLQTFGWEVIVSYYHQA